MFWRICVAISIVQSCVAKLILSDVGSKGQLSHYVGTVSMSEPQKQLYYNGNFTITANIRHKSPGDKVSKCSQWFYELLI